MKCRIDANLTIRINSSSAVLEDLNEAFEGTLRHELKHAMAYFWFAEDFAGRIDNSGTEKRCFGSFDHCFDVKEAIYASWRKLLHDFTANQDRHALDPEYWSPSPVPPFGRWDGYTPTDASAWKELERISRQYLQ